MKFLPASKLECQKKEEKERTEFTLDPRYKIMTNFFCQFRKLLPIQAQEANDSQKVTLQL